MVSEHQMDPVEVRRLLDELVRRLEEAGIEASIHVVGGSAMALLFPDDAEVRVTRDIDAAIEPTIEVRRVVDQMAADLGLSPGWLNANGTAFIPPRAVSPSIADSTTVALTHADARELIAMKLAASREQDLHDLGVLARHTGITDAEVLVQITFDAYGEDSVILNESRSDYLVMARQALARAAKRTKARPTN